MTEPDPVASIAGITVVCIGTNLPAPAAAARLTSMGADVVKVEPPGGDPLRGIPAWYEELTRGQAVLELDLKTPAGFARLCELLEDADVLLSSSRPSALHRLGLGETEVASRYPDLLRVAIVGDPPPNDEVPGHDLTYQASRGLVEAPALPRTLIADLAGAERAVSAALGLLLARERGLPTRSATVALSEAAEWFTQPIRHGATLRTGILGGAFPAYGLYETSTGWIAVAALEPHFHARLLELLGVPDDARALAVAFRRKPAEDWERWAGEHDLPLVAVREPGDR